MAKKFPIVVLTGPRQSGKTMLAKSAFPNYRYVSLENPDNLSFAKNDTKGFLQNYDKNVIFDEAQNAPRLFSYLQQLVDESGLTGQFILTGSQNYLMMERISQSLAGRVYLSYILPLSYSEIKPLKKQEVFETMITGGYPRIYDKDIAPKDFFPSYIQTYIERDVRTLLNIQNVSLFRRFLDLLALRAGQLFNASAVANALKVSLKTVQHWLSVLETGNIVFLLRPWHKNFSKRVIKTPKLYFYDSGLLAFLLGIEDKTEVVTSSHKGAIFENYAIVEIIKNHKNRGLIKNYYFWRDSNGNEIDIIIEQGLKVQCIEIKASQTVHQKFIKLLHYLDDLNHELQLKHYLLTMNEETQHRTHETILSWRDIPLIK